jgi:hypothetical protein
MKSFLFVCAMVVSQVASADIKIMSFEGIEAIHFNGNDYVLSLKYGEVEDFKVTFLSTSVLGNPLITGMVHTAQKAIAQSYPVLAVNQITSIETSNMDLFSYGPTYRIGIDGDNDAQLNSVSDDFISVQMTFK